MHDTYRIAPLGGSEGCTFPRPWNSRVTVALPHLDTLELLPVALDLWRMQTIRPYLVVVDTGSPWPATRDLEVFRAADCELHFLRSHGYRHPSAPVTAALDLAQSLCTTEFLLHTHVDVFPRRRDLLEMLLGKCSEEVPVVGWQMSPRDKSTSPNKHEWVDAVSHTCTMLHMPTVHVQGWTWSMQRYFAHRPGETGQAAAWPDTESAFAVAMRKDEVMPLLLGSEANFERHGNQWWDHARSYTGLKMSGTNGPLANALLFARAKGYTADALKEASERLEAWRAEDTARTGATPQAQPPAAASPRVRPLLGQGTGSDRADARPPLQVCACCLRPVPREDTFMYERGDGAWWICGDCRREHEQRGLEAPLHKWMGQPGPTQ